MKVLFFLKAPYPNGNATTNRIHNISKGIVENGIDLIVIPIKASENRGSIKNTSSKGIYEGVQYKYLSSKIIRSKNLIIRKLVDFIWLIKAFLYLILKKNEYDIVFINGPFLDLRLLLIVAVKIARKKIVLEINEYPFVGKKRFSRFKRIFFYKIIASKFNGFMVISENLKVELETVKNKKAKIIKTPILGEKIDLSKNTAQHSRFPYIVHAGSLTEEKDGILGLIKAFNAAKKKTNLPIKYYFTGNLKNSPIQEDIKKLMRDYSIEEDIVFTGFLPKEELQHLYVNAEMAIVNKYNNLQNKYCFASKLIDYISYRIPIITTSVGEVTFFLNNKNSLVVEPGNYKLLTEKILFILHHKKEVDELAINAEKLLLNSFNYRKNGKQIKLFLNQIYHI